MALRTLDVTMRQEDTATLFTTDAVGAKWSNPQVTNAKGVETNWAGTYNTWFPQPPPRFPTPNLK